MLARCIPGIVSIYDIEGPCACIKGQSSVCWSSVGGSHEPACQHVRVVRGPKVKVSQVGSTSWDSVRCEQVRPADTCKLVVSRLWTNL